MALATGTLKPAAPPAPTPAKPAAKPKTVPAPKAVPASPKPAPTPAATPAPAPTTPAGAMKEMGNTAFKAQKYHEAEEFYSNAIKVCAAGPGIYCSPP